MVSQLWLVVQAVKNPPIVWETWVQSLGWEDPLEKRMATQSSILAQRNPGQRSLTGYTVHRGHNELDTTEWLSLSLSFVVLRRWLLDHIQGWQLVARRTNYQNEGSGKLPAWWTHGDLGSVACTQRVWKLWALSLWRSQICHPKIFPFGMRIILR